MEDSFDNYKRLVPSVYAVRTAYENKRVSKHKRYQLYIQKESILNDGIRRIKLVDNNGDLMEPCINPNNSDYWRLETSNGVHLTQDSKHKLQDFRVYGEPKARWDVELPEDPYDDFEYTLNCLGKKKEDLQIKLHEEFHARVCNNINNINREDEPMKLDITTPTLVNGKDVEDMTDGDFIHTIKEVQTAIEKLQEVKIGSKRIDKLIKEHEANLRKLVIIFDKRK